ncbi:hypothetical protein FKM82_024947 [Ascaphus truei]
MANSISSQELGGGGGIGQRGVFFPRIPHPVLIREPVKIGGGEKERVFFPPTIKKETDLRNGTEAVAWVSAFTLIALPHVVSKWDFTQHCLKIQSVQNCVIIASVKFTFVGNALICGWEFEGKKHIYNFNGVIGTLSILGMNRIYLVRSQRTFHTIITGPSSPPA